MSIIPHLSSLQGATVAHAVHGARIAQKRLITEPTALGGQRATRNRAVNSQDRRAKLQETRCTDGAFATLREPSPPPSAPASMDEDMCPAARTGPDNKLVMAAVARVLQSDGLPWLHESRESAMNASFESLTPLQPGHGWSMEGSARKRDPSDSDPAVRVYASTPVGTYQHVRVAPARHPNPVTCPVTFCQIHAQLQRTVYMLSYIASGTCAIAGSVTWSITCTLTQLHARAPC